MLRMTAVALALISAAAALAAANWNGPGWYRTLKSAGGGALEAGPFPDEASCRVTLPRSDDDFVEYHCRYFESEPEDYD